MSAQKYSDLFNLAHDAKYYGEYGISNAIASYVAQMILRDMADACEHVVMALYTSDPIGEHPDQSFFDCVVFKLRDGGVERELVTPLPCIDPILAISIAKWGASKTGRNDYWDPSYNKSERKYRGYPFYPTGGEKWRAHAGDSHYDRDRCQHEDDYWHQFAELLPPVEVLEGDPDEADNEIVCRDHLGQLARHLVALVSDHPVNWKIFQHAARCLKCTSDLGHDQSAQVRADNARAFRTLETLIA